MTWSVRVLGRITKSNPNSHADTDADSNSDAGAHTQPDPDSNTQANSDSNTLANANSDSDWLNHCEPNVGCIPGTVVIGSSAAHMSNQQSVRR